MTIGAIHQPGYFPWIGVVDKAARADVFIVLDNVQFNRAAYQHRTLYSAQGGPKLLTLPVKKIGLLAEGRKICDMELSDPRAPSKHFETLKSRYRKSPGWRALASEIEEILLEAHSMLLDYTLATLRLTFRRFGVDSKLVLASELGCEGAKSELVINILKAVECDTYLSGKGASVYQTPQQFQASGIQLLYQNLIHPQWRQSHGGNFQPGCFALEWLLEEGVGARDAFWHHQRETASSALFNAG